MTLALLALLFCARPAAASAPQGSGGAFAVAQGAAAYAVVTDPGVSSGRLVVRRLGLDGGVLWEDRYGSGRGESAVGAAVTEWGGLSVLGDDDAGCFAAHWASRGNRLWEDALQYGSECHARAVLVDARGDTYALATTTSGGAIAPTVWKIDRRGSVAWSYRPAEGTSRYAFALTLDADGSGVTVTTATSGPNGWTYDSFDLGGDGRTR